MQFQTHRMEMVISFVSCPIADTSSSHSAIIYCNAFTFFLPMNILHSSSLHKPSFSVVFLSTSTHPSGSFSVLCIMTAKLFNVRLPCLGTEQVSKSLKKYHLRNASSHKPILIPHLESVLFPTTMVSKSVFVSYRFSHSHCKNQAFLFQNNWWSLCSSGCD